MDKDVVYVCNGIWLSHKKELNLAIFNMDEPKEHHAKWNKKVKVASLCTTLWESLDYKVHGILQARILEWVAFPFSRGSFQPRDQTQVSRIAGRFFTIWATQEAQEDWSG